MEIIQRIWNINGTSVVTIPKKVMKKKKLNAGDFVKIDLKNENRKSGSANEDRKVQRENSGNGRKRK